MLGCSTKQLVSIVEILFERNEFVTIKELSKQLSCDRKTITNHCKILSGYSSSIEIIKNKGIKMEMDFSDYTEFRNKLILECFNVQLLEYIFINREPTLKKLCNYYYTSEASIRRNIHEINVFLCQFNIKIKSKNEIFYFFGNEEVIRYTACTLLARYYFYTKWPFKNISKSEVNELLEKILKDNYSLLSEHIKLKWMYILAVNLIRYNQKFPLERSGFIYDTTKNRLIREAQSFLKKWNYTYEEIDFLFYLIQTTPIFFDQTFLGKSLLSWHKDNKTDMYMLTKKIIEKIDETFLRGQKVNNCLLEMIILSGVVKSTLFSDSKYLLNGDKISSLMNNNLNLCREVEVLLGKITFTEKFNKEWIRLSIVDALYAVFFKEEEREINVLLRTELSFGRIAILKRKIKQLLSARYCVNFVDNVYWDDSPLVIISTLPIKFEDEENGIFIREFLPPEDMKKIFFFINQYYS